MLRTLDRYLILESLLPFGLCLLVFTFILQIPPIMEQAEALIAKGVAWQTIGVILATLLPQALGITIPMALLIGVLMALGRLSGDRETVAMQACGISVFRMLRPLAVLAVVAWAATSWILIKAMPEANQMFREITYNIVASRAENEVKSRVFFEDFPNLVLYAREVPTNGEGWRDVFMADLRTVNHPVVFVARQGRMVLNRPEHKVDVELVDGAVHRTSPDKPEGYEVERFATMTLALDPETVFKRAGIQRGINEMRIEELREQAATLASQHLPNHAPVIAIQRKFSIPVACFVFAVIGLALGVTSRKDGKQASFVIGTGVIFVYYVIMYTAEAMTKGHIIPAVLAAWLPNIVLGACGLVMLRWRSRSIERRWSFLRLRARSGAPEPSDPVRRPLGATQGMGWGWRVPGPSILDRYIGRIYVQICVMAFIGLLGIFYIATFIDLSDKLFKGQTTGLMLLQYLWYATPQYVYYVLPIAALVSTLVSIGLLTKSSELIVMRACGISLYRSAVPLLLFAMLWSGALFTLEETILGPANRQAQALRHVIRGGSPQTFDVLNRRWMVGSDSTIYNYQFYDPRERKLMGVAAYHLDPSSWSLRARTFATEATYDGAEWQAQEGWTRAFTTPDDRGRYEAFSGRAFPFEPAETFSTEQPDAERMNYRQLRSFIDELRASGFNVVPYTVALQRKLSFPFVTLIMTLIAVPFAVTTGRRGALYGIGVGIVLAIVYWLLFSVFAAIGSGGAIAPALAAWAPNVLFSLAALYLLLTVRT
ncbi:MAG: LPS export ABC transporter permease LptG [Vicinamibacterales bacterium]